MMRFIGLFLLLSFGLAVTYLVPSVQAAPIILTFETAPGTPLSYTESGVTVTSLYPPPGSGHLHLADVGVDGDGELYNHDSCCSTPYEFVLNGGSSLFDMTSLVVENDFTDSDSLWTNNLGGSVVVSSVPGLFVFPAGWTSLSWVRWDQDYAFGTMTVDNVTINGSASVPEPGTLLLLSSGLLGLAGRTIKRKFLSPTHSAT